MRHMDLEDHTHKFIDVGEYIYNYEGFYGIGGERSQLKVPIQALREYSHFFSFSLGEEL